MATNAQLQGLLGEGDARALRLSVISATIKKAVAIGASVSPAAQAIAWAAQALHEPERASAPVFAFVVADNAAGTVAEIRALSDVAVQTSADKCIDQLLGKVG